jgi:ABC-type siderophore export system fused ATPase/permease subunit
LPQNQYLPAAGAGLTTVTSFLASGGIVKHHAVAADALDGEILPAQIALLSLVTIVHHALQMARHAATAELIRAARLRAMADAQDAPVVTISLLPEAHALMGTNAAQIYASMVYAGQPGLVAATTDMAAQPMGMPGMLMQEGRALRMAHATMLILS